MVIPYRLLSRKVRCWNVDNGCNAEGPASDMLGHFTNVCCFHVVICPRCSGKVPHLQMTDHLESCRMPPNLPEQPALDDNFVNAALEVREALRGISEKCASVESKLDSFEERLPPLQRRLDSEAVRHLRPDRDERHRKHL